jgi:hypothetical protein
MTWALFRQRPPQSKLLEVGKISSLLCAQAESGSRKPFPLRKKSAPAKPAAASFKKERLLIRAEFS